MRDNKLSSAGFKYPERIFGAKFQEDLTSKPALLSSVFSP